MRRSKGVSRRAKASERLEATHVSPELGVKVEHRVARGVGKHGHERWIVDVDRRKRVVAALARLRKHVGVEQARAVCCAGRRRRLLLLLLQLIRLRRRLHLPLLQHLLLRGRWLVLVLLLGSLLLTLIVRLRRRELLLRLLLLMLLLMLMLHLLVSLVDTLVLSVLRTCLRRRRSGRWRKG
jgi:hypothetical protein